MNALPDALVPSTPLLTVEEAAKVLRIGRSLAYQLTGEYLGSAAVHPAGWLFAGAALGAGRVGDDGPGRAPVRRRGVVGGSDAHHRRRTAMTTARRAVLLDVPATRVRRRLGPTAWSVFEELLARSAGHGPMCEAVTTTRALAADLGLSKDTVARALQMLRRSDLVEVVQDRTSAGTFGACRYLITVPDGITLRDAATAPSSKALRSTSADGRATRRAVSQLELTLD